MRRPSTVSHLSLPSYVGRITNVSSSRYVAVKTQHIFCLSSHLILPAEPGEWHCPHLI